MQILIYVLRAVVATLIKQEDHMLNCSRVSFNGAVSVRMHVPIAVQLDFFQFDRNL